MGLRAAARDTPKTVVTYYAYKATTAVEFYRPVMYLFFLAQGLTFTQIAVLEAVYNLTTVLGEVPSGYVGDRVGRRNSLLIGTALIAATLVGLGLASTFPAFVALYVCWSMGYNFRSGSEDAWLYDALSEALSGDDFAHVRGRGESVSLAMGVVGAVTGGYLGGVDLAYPFFVAAGVTALGLVALLAMDEPAVGDDSVAETLGLRAALDVVRRTVTQRDLRTFVVYYYVLFAGVTYLVFVFLQPVFETVVVGLGVDATRVESLLGLFYAAYSLVGALLSYYTGVVESRVGLRRWFTALPLVVGSALVAMLFVPVLALPTLLLIRGVADVTKTLASQYVNDRVESLGRATVLSAMAMVSGLTVIPFQLGSGALSDVTSPLVALAVAGGVLVVGSVAVLLVDQPIRDPTAADAASS